MHSQFCSCRAQYARPTSGSGSGLVKYQVRVSAISAYKVLTAMTALGWGAGEHEDIDSSPGGMLRLTLSKMFMFPG